MAQNFLYMFEFVVDDLLITRPNHCAPEEYPTCCEISFRSSVFVSICDREFGGCIDTSAPKCGKCCLFALECPVIDKDRLLIHIYKKKTEKCKFLVGATDIAIKPLFDKVTESFGLENPNWIEQVATHASCLPDVNKKRNSTAKTVVDNDCDNEDIGRKEQFCPTSELTKRLLPLFNMKGTQTGNLVLIMRLVCNGPTIVSSFPFAKMCSQPCAGGKKLPCAKSPSSCPSCQSPSCGGQSGGASSCGAPSCGGPASPAPGGGRCNMPDPCRKPDKKPPVCRRYFACNADRGCPCDECEDDIDRGCAMDCAKKNKTPGPCPSCQPSCCPERKKKQPKCPDPCQRSNNNDNSKGCQRASSNKVDSSKCCQRAFSNDNDNSKGCSCDECVDECEADDDSDDCLEEEEDDVMRPCFICPREPDPGPEAYDEFEACLNGSGLTIRVLKDTHQVESIYDGTENAMEDSGCECEKCPGKDNTHSNCESLCELLQKSMFARNHVKRRTAGHIVNNPNLPKIRANIKYSGNDACCSGQEGNYNVDLSKLKNQSEYQDNKVDMYRKSKSCNDDCGPIVPPILPGDNRHCCMQVEPADIKNALKGINADTRKKGIEVCYKTCDDTNSDIFLVKLGSKHHCQKKKNAIEIELKTPKEPLNLPKQKCTTETQINETELDAALADLCAKKKKGKKGKKGKGKGKGKKK